MNQNAWKLKVNRARKVEQEILTWFRFNYDKNAKLSQGYNAEYDIIFDKGTVEIKEDRMAHQTGNYALEFETHDGKPSGYAGTKSTYFVIVDWEYVSMMDTETLREIVRNMPVKKVIEMGETFPDGKRNKGYLIPREKILTNGLVTVMERWFPVYNG